MKLPSVEQVMKKCQQYQPHGVWGGYLTPVDIMALVEAGAEANDPHRASYARAQIAAGEGGGSWFYFRLGRLSKTWDGKPSDKGRKA